MTPSPASLLVTNIGELRTSTPQGTITDAAVACEDGVITYVGSAAKAPACDEVIDCAGRAVLPGWVDSHTHMVFAGDRAAEFEARMAGQSYAAGGIAVTMEATRNADENTLAALLDERIAAARAGGTTTLETKTGYGLSTPSEALAARLAASRGLEVTFLGAHVVPPGMDPADYVAEVTGPQLAAVKDYCRFIDVFVEEGAFNPSQAREIFAAGSNAGLIPKVHGNQLQPGEGVQLAVEVNAASVDHVNFVSDADIEALSSSKVVATVLPACDLSTRMPLAPARKLLDAGVRVAIASNLNPGTSYTSSMNFCVATAVLQMHLSLDEAIRAATLGGAMALRRQATDESGRDENGRPAVGQIMVGAKADLHILASPHAIDLAYRPGMPLTYQTIVGGQPALRDHHTPATPTKG